MIINIHHIRNATTGLEYAGKKFLIDPMLAEKGTMPPLELVLVCPLHQEKTKIILW